MDQERAKQNLSEFEKDHPMLAAWWRNSPFKFPNDMRDKVRVYGNLTAGQLSASIRCANKFSRKAS